MRCQKNSQARNTDRHTGTSVPQWVTLKTHMPRVHTIVIIVALHAHTNPLAVMWF